MTTREAAARYLNEHLQQVGGRPIAVFNPNNKPTDELPLIMCFNNTKGESDWNSCYAMAEDGTVLGNHVCSHESYLPHDLGVLEGCRKDRHEESYQKHYPDGYVMEYIPQKKIESHAKFQAAWKLNIEKGAVAKAKGESDVQDS